MNNETILINNKQIMISESSDGTYLDTKFIICDFEPNKNKVQLQREGAEALLSGLENMPVVGKVVKNKKNEDDLSGHNMRIEYKKNPDTGEYEAKAVFDTVPLGSFYDPKIETIDDHEYITSRAKIWTRYENSANVIKKLYSEDKLTTSWEIMSSEFYYNDDNVKVLTNYSWLGSALLGSEVTPAYSCAKVIEVSSINEDQLLLANAIAQDLQGLDIKDDELDINKNEEDEDKEEDLMPKASNKNAQVEQSDVTMQDLYSKLSKSVDAKMDKYMYISMIFPETHKLWAYHWSRESELDFVEFSYQVLEDDSVAVGEPIPVKLSMTYASESTNPNVNIQVNLDDTAKLLSSKEIEITNLKGEISILTSELEGLKSEIIEKTDALVKVSETITTLESEIATLKPFKDAADAIAQAEAEKVLAEQKESLKNLALKSGFIVESELEDEAIKSAIDAIDEASIKVIIANRFIAKLNEKPAEATPTPDPKLETSTTPEVTPSATANINLDDEEAFDPKAIMSSYLKRK